MAEENIKSWPVLVWQNLHYRKVKEKYYLSHGLCRLWEGGQAEQVATIKKELMNEIEDNVNLNVMSILKEL